MTESVAKLFIERIEATPNNLAYRFPVGDSDEWTSLTWKQTYERVRRIACGLRSLGLTAEERCAILSQTRIDWILADLGILCGGGATTTIYPASTPSECTYIIVDSNSRFVFAENDEQVQKLVQERQNLPQVKKVITFDGKADGDWIITLKQLEDMGSAFDQQNPGEFNKVVDAIKKEHLATLIYTSGTTGRPKGVELTNDCWVFEADAIRDTGLLLQEDLQYLWLPLSHSFGKVLEVAQWRCGFPTAVDGRIPKLIDNLAVIRPTFMAAAPRIFEKVHNKVVAGAEEAGGLKLKIFRWAIGVGRQVSQLRQNGKEPTGLLLVKYKVANKLVFSKLKARFGGRVKFFISGSAPLSREMAEFFHAADILIMEGYGLTESSAASCVNVPAIFKFGTVGKPLNGVKVKIAEDGEILISGRGIMRGYHNMPEATRDALTEDGWLRTGDIGELDSEGRVKITDRKKDLIKTSGGKYVAPAALEGKLKSKCPYVGNVLVHGDRRNFVSALITVDAESIRGWANENGLNNASYQDILGNHQLQQMIKHAVDQMNTELASYETIKKFAVLPKDFTVEDGELTASLKVKRKVVENKYKEILDGFYSSSLRA